ncbi:hypothetical protein [Thiosocius teredinicola]|uniref:hypothetical protein n=1 Tax=Thiosocius teredinicola TaxID=1973002 RepID=UPI000991014E
MNEFNTRKHSLEQQVDEMEATLLHLKAQLKEENEREQHAAIDRLEEYLDDLNNKNANLQAFWKTLRSEIADLFSGDSANSK